MNNTTKIKVLAGLALIALLAIGILVLRIEKRIIVVERSVDDLKILNELRTPVELKAVEVDEMIWKIIDCESKWDENAKGDLDYVYQAYGLIQVQQRTWDYLSEKMGFEGDIKSPHDQIRFLTLALEKGFGNYWTCYRKLYGKTI